MNERIKELAEQATNDVKDEFGHWINSEFNKEKFAQLIVRECIERITGYDLVPGHSAKWEDIYDIHSRLLQNLGEDLKEHFGVEL